MHRQTAIELTDSERSELEAIVRDCAVHGRRRRRARIVLLAADGHNDMEISATLQCALSTVRAWRRRFATGGLAVLPDAAPRSRPRAAQSRGDAAASRGPRAVRAARRSGYRGEAWVMGTSGSTTKGPDAVGGG